MARKMAKKAALDNIARWPRAEESTAGRILPAVLHRGKAQPQGLGHRGFNRKGRAGGQVRAVHHLRGDVGSGDHGGLTLQGIGRGLPRHHQKRPQRRQAPHIGRRACRRQVFRNVCIARPMAHNPKPRQGLA